MRPFSTRDHLVVTDVAAEPDDRATTDAIYIACLKRRKKAGGKELPNRNHDRRFVCSVNDEALLRTHRCERTKKLRRNLDATVGCRLWRVLHVDLCPELVLVCAGIFCPNTETSIAGPVDLDLVVEPASVTNEERIPFRAEGEGPHHFQPVTRLPSTSNSARSPHRSLCLRAKFAGTSRTHGTAGPSTGC